MKAPEPFAVTQEIFWRESQNIYQPTRRPLPDFLSTIDLISNRASPPTDRPLLVYLEQGCLDRMNSHAGQNILREQAGILCGQAYQSDEQHYVVIESAIAVDTFGDAGHFRFHQDSWQELWMNLGDNHNIIGWYHTHPGMGVFLSPTDLRTQQLYFSSPWQIAMVIDPISRETGIFYGTLGTRLEEDSGFTYIRR
jgi:proteasome lid subunit RPN8/RPN11